MEICQSCTINFNFTAQSRNGNNRLLTWLTSSSHSLYNCDLHFLSPVLSSRCVYFIYIYVYNIYFSIIVFITYYLYACIFIFIFIFILIFIFIFIYIYIYIRVSICICVYHTCTMWKCRCERVNRAMSDRARSMNKRSSEFSISLSFPYTFLLMLNPRQKFARKNKFPRVKNRKSIAKWEKTGLHRTTSSPPSHFFAVFFFVLFPSFLSSFSASSLPNPHSTLLNTGCTPARLSFHDHRWWSSKNCSVQ